MDTNRIDRKLAPDNNERRMSEAPAEPSKPLGRPVNWKAILTILAVGVASLFLVSWLMNLFLVHVVYRLIVWTTGDLTGINLYLLKAIAWAAIALLLYFKKPWFRWLRGFNSRIIGLFVILLAYNLWMYGLTYNLLFRFSDGKPMKWAAITNEGIKYYASPGFGPDGQRLVEVTPETLKKLKSWDKPLSRVDPDGVTWFNPNTGQPEIYYVETSSGDYEFFNRWGHHPQTGAELKPVSHDVKRAFEQRKTEVVSKARQAAESDRERATLAKEEETRRKATAEKEEAVTKLKALIHRTKMDSTKVNVVFVLDAPSLNSGNAAEAQAKLVSALQRVSDRLAIYDNVLRPEFAQNGFFEKAFNGDYSFLKDTGLFDTANFLLLFRLKAESSADDAFRGVFSCRTELTYRVLNQHSEQVGSGSIHAIGPGFSAQAALLRGIEIGVEQNASKLIRVFDPTVHPSP
jgi:hypothetical protein